MKKIGYQLFKTWIKAALYLYYGKIEIHGLESVPKNGPVIFLPNHQNALLDVLLIAVDCNRKPYFLTRSDVFKGKFLKTIFDFFQMIPIYRIRDGRESLKNNQAVFDICAELLMNNEAILMFPEANHNVKRRVRNLSKGFTRILFNALDSKEDLDVQIVPIGINYRDSVSFPDKVALYFGKPIQTRALYDSAELRTSIEAIKEIVSTRLKSLTTHIADEVNYEKISRELDALEVDYLNPMSVNKTIAQLSEGDLEFHKTKKEGIGSKLVGGLFMLLNLPMMLIWRFFIKPKVWEPEFTGTLRFTFALLAYPFYYLILFVVLALTISLTSALVTILFLFLFNWMYVWHN